MIGFLKRIGRNLPVLRDIHRYILALEKEREALKAEIAASRQQLVEEAGRREREVAAAARQEREAAQKEIDELKEDRRRNWTWVPVGDSRSPIPNTKELEPREAELFDKVPAELPGIEMYPDEQLALLKELKKFWLDAPYKPEKTDGMRYAGDNPDFSMGDALVLYGMMRKMKPRKVVEIGSGYSTAAVLDANEVTFGKNIAVTVLDRDPHLLRSLMKKEDVEKTKILKQPLHEVPIEVFTAMTQGDLLLVETSHVVKTGSDVLNVVFRILPRLKLGTIVHVSGVYYPFENPRGWVFDGRATNETYLWRAFFQNNAQFEILFFGSFLEQFHRAALDKDFPRYGKSRTGGLWFRKK